METEVSAILQVKQHSIGMTIKALNQFPSGWKTKINTPCPLLLPCTACNQLMPATDFYPSKRGRKTIIKESVLSTCKSCGIEKYRQLDKRQKLFYAAKRRANSANLQFDLIVNEIHVPEKCPVLGIQFKDYTGSGRGNGNKNFDAASIDRINNAKGYIRENICVISRRANTLKSDGSPAEIANLLSYILERRSDFDKDDKLAFDRLKAALVSACSRSNL